jgi:hypothetical protein
LFPTNCEPPLPRQDRNSHGYHKLKKGTYSGNKLLQAFGQPVSGILAFGGFNKKAIFVNSWNTLRIGAIKKHIQN